MRYRRYGLQLLGRQQLDQRSCLAQQICCLARAISWLAHKKLIPAMYFHVGLWGRKIRAKRVYKRELWPYLRHLAEPPTQIDNRRNLCLILRHARPRPLSERVKSGFSALPVEFRDLFYWMRGGILAFANSCYGVAECTVFMYLPGRLAKLVELLKNGKRRWWEKSRLTPSEWV